MKILIADDDAVSQLLLKTMMERAGYEVITADNGRKALDHLRSTDGPRLALIDWVMPELDGPGVCHEMRRAESKAYTYIILLTSKESKANIVEGLKSGADDYLIKPCNLEELKARLQAGQRILDLEDKLVEAREEMRFKASHDSLTSLWNRGTILELLDKELVRSRRERSFLSLLLCDVDHFKQINDEYGHPVGDEVLQQVAKRLSEALRSYDSVGRYGGEEFLILLTGCNSTLTGERGEQVRKAIASQTFATSRGPLSVTISIGALATCEWPATFTGGDLLKKVDEVLYDAKAAGRNRVIVAHPATKPSGEDLLAEQSLPNQAR